MGEYPPTHQRAPLDDALPADKPGRAASVLRLLCRLTGLKTEMAGLAGLGMGKPLVASVAAQSLENGTRLSEELIAEGLVDEEAFYGSVARALRLPFVAELDDFVIRDAPDLDRQLCEPWALRLNPSASTPLIAIAPGAHQVERLKASLSRSPRLKTSLMVTTPSAIRRAVWRAGESRRLRETISDLFERRPQASARITMSAMQGFVGGVLALGLCLIVISGQAPLFLFHVLLTLLYLATLLFRSVSLFARKQRRQVIASDSQDAVLPVYTVMVALYHEAPVAGQLVSMLKRLNWPPSRLDIKLVCEADDHATIRALKSQRLGPQFEIVEVPAMHPRTKPKALTYALAGARGRYLTIYDAEDRVHPDQLREAHSRFSAGPPELVCLQAPLVIANAAQGWLASIFALEYAALFRTLLPMLGRFRLPLPLGGTSNHFKTEALRSVGGWDPFNVTEDADLGMRLYRLGYHADVLSKQTLEDAPTRLPVWLRQRTRWFKGWLQTWLVMMRQPLTLAKEMGLWPFLVFQLLIGGMLISSLAHPLILLFVAQSMVAMLYAPSEGMSFGTWLLFLADWINIFGSYCLFVVLGTVAMSSVEKRQVGFRWTGVVFYWVLISIAAWRAVFELRSRPFFWHKTPHAPSGRSKLAPRRVKIA